MESLSNLLTVENKFKIRSSPKSLTTLTTGKIII